MAEKDHRAITADLRPIYRAATEDEAQQLGAFETKWSGRYPLIAKSWHANWVHIIPFFAFPAEIRRVIYTTNAIESLNYSLRKVIKNRSLFPSEEAIFKLLYLALDKISAKWTMPIRDWQRALHQFAILFEGRVPLP